MRMRKSYIGAYPLYFGFSFAQASMKAQKSRRFVRSQPAPNGDDLPAAIDAMRRVMRELRLIARKNELATGLSAAQTFVLTVLAERPGVSVTEIAGTTLTDRSSVAAVVDRLVENGYATRDQSAQDRRRAVITATPLGRRALRQAAPPPTVVLIAAMGRLATPDRKSLATGLTALAVAMGIADQPPGMLFEDAPPKRRRRRAHAR